MHPIIPVMAGGAIGAGLRYLTSIALSSRSGWPLATLTVNIIGALAMGMLLALFLRGAASETMRLFVGVGILGGFTTFSAFSLESFEMIQRGQAMMAVFYAVISVVGSIAALAAGFALVRS